MTGTCVNTIKIIGVSSLGLLTGSLAYQTVEIIPRLLDELSTSVSNYSWKNIKCGKLINSVLLAISSTCFALSYKYSPTNEKHPYLIYSIFGGLLSYGYTYFKSRAQERKLAAFNVPQPTKKPAAAAASQEVTESPDDDLGKSYIHVSDEDSTSAVSTPPQSTPSSPTIGSGDVEDEINLSLFKKDMKKGYVDLKNTYLIGTGAFGFTFLISTIGIIGDFILN